MFLTKTFAQRILGNIEKNPLQVGEIRHLTGSGKKYIALSETEVDEYYYSEVGRIEVRGTLCIIYHKTTGSGSTV